MNKGLEILLKSFGLTIDPAQIEDAFEKGKDALPRLAKSFDELNGRLERIEVSISNLNDKFEFVLANTTPLTPVAPDPVHADVLAVADANELTHQIVNGQMGALRDA